jgi:hypothetical protein
MTSHNLTAREWNEDEGDISMEAEQLESSVLATKEQSAIRSTTDREGDVSMEEEGERPAGLGSAIVEQFAIRLEKRRRRRSQGPQPGHQQDDGRGHTRTGHHHSPRQ